MSHFTIAKNITNNWFIFQDINILIQFTFQLLFLSYSNVTETFFRSTLIHKLCYFCGIPAATGKVKGSFLNLNGIHIHQKTVLQWKTDSESSFISRKRTYLVRGI